MAYPTTLDNFNDPQSSDKLNSPSHSTLHRDVNTAIEALETKVGVDGSAVNSSHSYKLSEVTGSDKTVGKSATQTLTNKTFTSPIITNKSSTGTDSGTESLSNKTLSASTLEGINNTPVITQKETGGTARTVANIDSSNTLHYGDSSLTGNSMQLDNVVSMGQLPLIELRKSSNQTITSGSSTVVTWNVEMAKNLITHSNSTNTSRITIIYPGTYLISARLRWTVTIGAYEVALDLLKNGTASASIGAGINGSPTMWGTWTIEVAANDYLEISAYQVSGSDKTLESGSAHYQCRVRIVKIA